MYIRLEKEWELETDSVLKIKFISSDQFMTVGWRYPIIERWNLNDLSKEASLKLDNFYEVNDFEVYNFKDGIGRVMLLGLAIQYDNSPHGMMPEHAKFLDVTEFRLIKEYATPSSLSGRNICYNSMTHHIRVLTPNMICKYDARTLVYVNNRNLSLIRSEALMFNSTVHLEKQHLIGAGGQNILSVIDCESGDCILTYSKLTTPSLIKMSDRSVKGQILIAQNYSKNPLLVYDEQKSTIRKVEGVFSDHTFDIIRFFPSGDRLLFVTDDSTIIIVDAHTYKIVSDIKYNYPRSTITSVAISPDENALIIGADDRISNYGDCASFLRVFMLQE